MNPTIFWAVAVAAVLAAGPAAAYIGPGAGIGVIGSFLAVLAGIVLAVGVVLFWPIRYVWRRMRGRPATATGAASSAGEATVVRGEEKATTAGTR